MIIDNKELVELLEQEKVLLDELEGAKKEIEELGKQIQKVKEDNKEKLEESKELRDKIASIFIPVVLEQKGEFETFGNPEVVDGKVHIELIDNKEKAYDIVREKIKEGDDIWVKYIEDLKKVDEAKDVIKSQ